MDTHQPVDRLRRVSSLWNWLPAFRVVAETEHLPTASKRLNISASALSRTIRMIERDLGEPLFNRSGRNLELNEAGSKLLSAVRDAMRLVHQGLRVLGSHELIGPIYIASTDVLTTTHVLPALHQLRFVNPTLLPHVVHAHENEVNDKLLQGKLDISFSQDPIRHSQLTTVCIGHEPISLYCGPNHSLFPQCPSNLDAILVHEFVAPPPDENGRILDGWPGDIERKIGIYASEILDRRELCNQGQYLAALPDILAQNSGSALRRLQTEVIPPCSIFATHRPTLGPPGRAEAILEAVQRHIQYRQTPTTHSEEPLPSSL